MVVQLGALRNALLDALLAANVPAEAAEKAADEVAVRQAATRKRLNVLSWIMVANVTATVMVLVKLLR